MRIIIAGSRTMKDYNFLENKCLEIISREQYDLEIPTRELEIVSGHAYGADMLGERFSVKWLGKKATRFPAKWDDLKTPPVYLKKNSNGWYNTLAGDNRNKEMAEYLTQDGGGLLIAFLHGESKGTKNMIRVAKKAGIIKIYKIDCDKENQDVKEFHQLAAKL